MRINFDYTFYYKRVCTAYPFFISGYWVSLIEELGIGILMYNEIHILQMHLIH